MKSALPSGFTTSTGKFIEKLVPINSKADAAIKSGNRNFLLILEINTTTGVPGRSVVRRVL